MSIGAEQQSIGDIGSSPATSWFCGARSFELSNAHYGIDGTQEAKSPITISLPQSVSYKPMGSITHVRVPVVSGGENIAFHQV